MNCTQEFNISNFVDFGGSRDKVNVSKNEYNCNNQLPKITLISEFDCELEYFNDLIKICYGKNECSLNLDFNKIQKLCNFENKSLTQFYFAYSCYGKK